MKTIVNALAIGLPVLLIVIGFLRPANGENPGRTKTLNGLTMFAAVVLLLVGVIRFLFPLGDGVARPADRDKPLPIAVSRHSDIFNNSLETALRAYYGMTEAFVNWDTPAINRTAASLETAIDSIQINELKKDTTRDADKIYLTAVDFISNAKNEVANLLQQPLIDKKRIALNELTDNLRNLLITVKYDKQKIFYQECPMAFDDDIPGYWLSTTSNVRNPYLGTKHPKYQATMLNCGKPKDSIDFVPPNTKN
jgi:hypothetical protein